MERKIITNEVNFVGTVVTKYTTGGATVLYINTGQNSDKFNYPRAVAFGNAKTYADRIEVGDIVTISGNLQSNSRDSGSQYPRTISVSHIGKIEGEFTPKNRFTLYGRINNIRKVNPELAVGTVTVWTRVKNRIKVVYRGTPDDVDRFCSLRAQSFIRFGGYIETDEEVDTDYSDRVIVTNYRFVPPVYTSSGNEK